MSSPFSDIQKKKYKIIRGASHGTDISLVSAYDGFHAGFECAEKVAKVLGPAGMRDWGTKSEPLPSYVIPLEQMQKACEKLSQHYSIALLDQLPNEKGNIAWGLIWKIKRSGDAKQYSLEDF